MDTSRAIARATQLVPKQRKMFLLARAALLLVIHVCTQCDMRAVPRCQLCPAMYAEHLCMLCMMSVECAG